MASKDPLPFIDLGAQRRRLGPAVHDAVARVLDSGAYILGPEVFELEQALARFCGATECVSCGSGTEALALVLMAKGVRQGDAVFVPSFTFVATAEVVAWLGATPVFVDVDAETFNMDPASLEAAVHHAKATGLSPAGVIPVDLFGQPADYEAIAGIAAAHGVWLMADCAQSFGATRAGRRAGSFGDASATSFFPAKPLGCYGDGGAVTTDDAELAEIMRSLRVHGQGEDKYTNIRIGMNGRMDTVQAAVLLEKLRIFPEELESRAAAARRYSEALGDVVTVPVLAPDATSSWAQYTIRLDGGPARREAVQRACAEAGVPTAIYYPIPLHRQQAYRHYPSVPGGLPVSDSLSAEVLSLPMHAYLDAAAQERVVDAVRAGLRAAN